MIKDRAPDIRYLDGRYVLYFTVHNTTTTPDNWDYAIDAAYGKATATFDYFRVTR